MMLAELLVTGRPWGLAEIAIALVVAAGICAIAYIGLKALEMTPPPWVIHVFWVVVVVVVVVLAIRFLAGL